MLRRGLLGGSLFALFVGLIGSIQSWVSGDPIPGWVPAVSLLGLVLLILGLSVALRDILNTQWRMGAALAKQDAKVAALGSSVRTLDREQAARDDVLLREVGRVEKGVEERIDALEGSLSERTSGLDRGLSESIKMTEAIAGQLPETTAAIQKVARFQKEKLAEDLAKIKENQDERIRPPLLAIGREQGWAYRQLESLISLQAALDLNSVLPRMRQTWAIDPDSAAFLVRTLLETRPRKVVEMGSGVSTILVAKALQKLGGGHFRSLEQSAEFRELTATALRAEGLEHDVELREAPLVDVAIGSEQWQWYEPASLDGIDDVDLVIVDGPPSKVGPLARYPAMPLLAEKLSPGALIFLDDANREEELAIVERWMKEYPLVAQEVPKLEKGAALLKWMGP